MAQGIDTNTHGCATYSVPLAKDMRDYIKSQLDYYVQEADSYRQMAEGYVPEIDSVTDTAFGIITGCTYMMFLQMFQTRGTSPSAEDVAEFSAIIKARTPEIRKALKGTIKSKSDNSKTHVRN